MRTADRGGGRHEAGSVDSLLRDLCAINEDLLSPTAAIWWRSATGSTRSSRYRGCFCHSSRSSVRSSGRTRASGCGRRFSTFGAGRALREGAVRVCDGEGRQADEALPDPETHPWLEKAIGWYREGVTMVEIARRLNEARVRPRYGRIREWTLSKIYELLRTMQVHRSRSVGSEARYDKHEAYTTAYRLRCDGHTMPFIAARLNADGLRPLKAAQYTWHSVQDLALGGVSRPQHAARAGAVSKGTGTQPARDLSPAGASRALSQARRSVVSADGKAADGQLVGRLLLRTLVIPHQPFFADGVNLLSATSSPSG